MNFKTDILFIISLLMLCQKGQTFHLGTVSTSNSACVGSEGTPETTLNVTCDTGNVIAVNQIVVGAKPTADNCSDAAAYMTNPSCCDNSASDCIFNFEITEANKYYEFNGRNSDASGVQNAATDNKCSPDTAYPQHTNYMYMEYSCIEESSIYSICTSVNISTAAVFVWSDGFPGNIPSTVSECNCSIQANDTSASILVQTIQRVLTANTAEDCSQILLLQDSSGAILQNWTCGNNIYNMENITVNSNGVVLSLLNTREVDDGNFWISFEATTPSTHLTLTCPANLTTESTTTSSTSTSTTSTTTSTSTTTASTTTSSTSTSTTTTTPTTTSTPTTTKSTTTSSTTSTSISSTTSSTTSTTTASPTSSDSDNDDAYKVFFIIGAVVAVLLLILVIVLAFIICLVRREKAREERKTFQHELGNSQKEQRAFPKADIENEAAVTSSQGEAVPGANTYTKLSSSPKPPKVTMMYATGASVLEPLAVTLVDKATNTSASKVSMIDEATQAKVDTTDIRSQIKVSVKSKGTKTPKPVFDDKRIQTRKIEMTNRPTQCKAKFVVDFPRIDTGSQTETNGVEQVTLYRHSPGKDGKNLNNVQDNSLVNKSKGVDENTPDQDITREDREYDKVDNHESLETPDQSKTDVIHRLPVIKKRGIRTSTYSNVCNGFYYQEREDLHFANMVDKMLSGSKNKILSKRKSRKISSIN